MRQFRFNPEQLRDVTPRQRSLYRATICLILASGDRPLDFHSRAVLNRCLIDSATNQRISCSAPSVYMAELRDETGFPMQAVLSSHLIPYGPESGLWSDDYERFLQQRLELVAAAIEQVSGSTHEKPALFH